MLRALALAAFVATGTAQPHAECTNELVALVRSAASVNEVTCAALAAFEGCIARVEDRAVQNGLEIELSAKQERLQGCRTAPMTAAIRTERDALDVAGREIRFHRTIRQTINVHTLNEEVGHNADNITAMKDEISGMSNQISTSESAMQSRMEASAANLRSDVSTAQSQLAVAMAALTTTTENTVSTSVAAMNDRITTQLAAAAATAATTTQALNTSVQRAITAANNAAVPHVYIQWGARACSAASGASVVKLYDGMMYGARHQYAGSGGNQFCLKNSGGDQGGVRQGGQDSNDIMVPVRKDHSNYNGIPSANNHLRQRDGYNIPCAKCKYAKSCFMEAGVPDCPSGFFKMYTGYLHGGHQHHHGNNNRVCLDKNPASNDYRNAGQWDAHIYPSIAKDGSGAGPRNGHVVPACHMCCVR